MSSYVLGFIPSDEEWQQKKAAWEACVEAGIQIPDELYDFFGEGGDGPDDAGKVVALPDGVVTEWSDGDMSSGFEVDVKKLPKNVTVVRFVNSW
jgi:hypothetical protein